MRRVLGVLLFGLAVLPATAANTPTGCAWLCGNWVVAAELSDSPEQLVDAALLKFKEPRPRRPPRPPDLEDPWAPDVPPEPEFRPDPGTSAKSALRKQLLSALAPSASLVVAEQADAILIRATGEERRVFPGAPHARVTAQGTIKISTQWEKDVLVIKEDQGRQHRTTETYARLPDGNLHLTRILERPGLKTLRLSVIYRRGQTQALESGPPGRTPIRAP